MRLRVTQKGLQKVNLPLFSSFCLCVLTYKALQLSYYFFIQLFLWCKSWRTSNSCFSIFPNTLMWLCVTNIGLTYLTQWEVSSSRFYLLLFRAFVSSACLSMHGIRMHRFENCIASYTKKSGKTLQLKR